MRIDRVPPLIEQNDVCVLFSSSFGGRKPLVLNPKKPLLCIYHLFQRIFLLEIWSPEISLSQKSSSYYEFGENSKTSMFFQLSNRPVFGKFDAMILICGELSWKMPMILIDFECLFWYGKKWKIPLFENMKQKLHLYGFLLSLLT